MKALQMFNFIVYVGVALLTGLISSSAMAEVSHPAKLAKKALEGAAHRVDLVQQVAPLREAELVARNARVGSTGRVDGGLERGNSGASAGRQVVAPVVLPTARA